MKKKMVILATGLMVSALFAGNAQAKTIAIDSGDGSGTKYITITETAQQGTAEVAVSRGDDEVNWRKQQIKEEIACLEPYGVSYDEEKDCLFYQGKTVRLLIDEQIKDTFETLQMPAGEIDLYTVRAEDFRLTGVREATQEEYNLNTKEIEITNESTIVYSINVVDGDNVGYVIPKDVESVCEDATEVYETEYNVAVESANDVEVTTTYMVQDYSAAQDPVAVEAEKKKTSEYKSVGIEQDKQGGWLWKGQKIDWLVDEDGGIYMSNSNKEKKDRVYILIIRDDDGSIREVKEVSLEEAMKDYLLNN